VNEFYMVYQIGMLVWGAGVFVTHLILAIAVWNARPPRRVLLSNGLWGAIVLVGGVTAVAVYWFLHFGLLTRVDRSICSACGYDRRGLALNAPCPECGTP
jgi:hypothetical protein